MNEKTNPDELEDWHPPDDYYIPPTLDLMACVGLWILMCVGVALEVLDK